MWPIPGQAICLHPVTDIHDGETVHFSFKAEAPQPPQPEAGPVSLPALCMFAVVGFRTHFIDADLLILWTYILSLDILSN